MKFGKNTNESMPHVGCRAGLTVGQLVDVDVGRSHGPNRPLRSTRSIGLTMLRSLGGDMPPHDDTMRVRTVDVVGQRLEAVAWSLRDSSAVACFACRTGAW